MLDHPFRSLRPKSRAIAEPRYKNQGDDRVLLDKRKQFRLTGVGIMRHKVVLTLILLSSCSAIPTRAAETSPLKCGVNEDRVWVYDSLSSFDVAMKLKCGEPVEVIGHEKGYVKIRTSGGREGYVEAKAIPKPPAAEENSSSGSEAQAGPEERPSVVAAARTKSQASSASSVNEKPVASAPASDASKPVAVLDATNPRVESATGSGASATISTSTQPSNSVASLAGALNSSQSDPAPSAAGSQTKPATLASVRSTSKVPDETGSSPKTVPVHVNKTKPGDSSSAGNSASKNSVKKATSVRTVAVSSSSAPAPKTTGTATPKTSSSKTVASSKPAVTASDPGPSVSSTNVVLADNVASEPTPSVENVHVVTTPRDPDDEEDPPKEPLERRENCKIYFSAYGLSPNQYRWMTQNRGKNFSGICPAPSPSMVDFVVIFTHDADFFNGTMPTPVHIDKNGFSDFTPLTTIDTAVVPPSDADKNRRECVWVFHTKRGTFDPAKFSPRRKPLFSTTESNKIGTAAGRRSAEDALRFMEQQGVIQ